MIIRTPPKLTNKNSIITYVEVSLWSWLRDLYVGFFKINFGENFQSFTVKDLEIPPNTEISISNQFNLSLPGNIPSHRIITRQKGDGLVVDGDTPWTNRHVYLKNLSSTDPVIITVIFFR